MTDYNLLMDWKFFQIVFFFQNWCTIQRYRGAYSTLIWTHLVLSSLAAVAATPPDSVPEAPVQYIQLHILLETGGVISTEQRYSVVALRAVSRERKA